MVVSKKTKHRTPPSKSGDSSFGNPPFSSHPAEVVDSIESQSLASKTTFPSHLLDLVVSLRAYLRDDAWIWFFCLAWMYWNDVLMMCWWSIDVWLYGASMVNFVLDSCKTFKSLATWFAWWTCKWLSLRTKQTSPHIFFKLLHFR